MKTRIWKFITGLVLAGLALAPAFAQVNDYGNHNFGGDINLDGNWYVKGTRVTVSGAQLNSAGGGSSATITPTTITNANGVIWMSNVNVRAGGGLTVGAAGTVTVPTGSVASLSVAGGSMPFPITLSNASTKVYSSFLITPLLLTGTTNINAQITTEVNAGTNGLRGDTQTKLNSGTNSLRADIVAAYGTADTAATNALAGDTATKLTTGTNDVTGDTATKLTAATGTVSTVYIPTATNALAGDTATKLTSATGTVATVYIPAATNALAGDTATKLTAGTNAVSVDIKSTLTTVDVLWTNSVGVAAVSNVNIIAGGNLLMGAGATITIPAYALANNTMAHGLTATGATACAFDFSPTVTNDGIATWFTFTATNGEVYVFPAKQLCD